MPKRLQIYHTPALTVTFDPNRCTHSGDCLRGLPQVFDIKRKRWIRPELAPADTVAAQIIRCPSGALQFQRPGEPGPPSSAAAGPGNPVAGRVLPGRPGENDLG